MGLEDLVRTVKTRLAKKRGAPPIGEPEPSPYTLSSGGPGGLTLGPGIAYVWYSRYELSHDKSTHPILMTKFLADCAAFVVFDPINKVGALAHCPGKAGHLSYEEDAERIVGEVARGYQWSDKTQIGIYGTQHPESVAEVVERQAKTRFKDAPIEGGVAEAEGGLDVYLDTRDGTVKRIYRGQDEFQSDFSEPLRPENRVIS